MQGGSRARKGGGGEGCKKMALRNISGIFSQNHMDIAALRVVREKDIAVTHFTKISPLNLFLNGGFWRRITWFSGGNGGGISRRQQIIKKMTAIKGENVSLQRQCNIKQINEENKEGN